ncbi:unnamed protein product [Trichobilharzia regenti]|nr:unnamed protein product [Trichobilharzia regenti]
MLIRQELRAKERNQWFERKQQQPQVCSKYTTVIIIIIIALF